MATIRECTQDDFQNVFPLFQQLWIGKPINETDLHRVFEQGLSSPSQVYLCAVKGWKLVGFCSMTINNNLWIEGNIGHIDELIVDSTYRGKGIGRKLIERMKEIAQINCCRIVELDSGLNRKNAHDFYDHVGFEKRGYVFSKNL